MNFRRAPTKQRKLTANAVLQPLISRISVTEFHTKSSLRQKRRADVTSGPIEGTLVYIYKKQAMSGMTRTGGALTPARQRKGTIISIGLCGSHALTHQTCKVINL